MSMAINTWLLGLQFQRHNQEQNIEDDTNQASQV